MARRHDDGTAAYSSRAENLQQRTFSNRAKPSAFVRDRFGSLTQMLQSFRIKL